MESSLKAEQDISGTSEETQDDKQVTSALAAIGANPKSPFVIPIEASLSAGYGVSNLFLDASGSHWTKLVIFNLTEKPMTPGASWFDSGRLSEKSEWGLEDGGFVEIPYKGYTVVFSTARSNPSTGSSGYLYYKIGDGDKVAIAFSNLSTEDNAINVGRKGEETWKEMTDNYDEAVSTKLDNGHYAVFYNQSSNPHIAVVAIYSETFRETDEGVKLRGAIHNSPTQLRNGLIRHATKYIKKKFGLDTYEELRRSTLLSKLCNPFGIKPTKKHLVYNIITISGELTGNWIVSNSSVIQIINLTTLTLTPYHSWFSHGIFWEELECGLTKAGFNELPPNSGGSVCITNNASLTGSDGLIIYKYNGDKKLYIGFSNPFMGKNKVKVGGRKEVYDETTECYEKIRKYDLGGGIFARYKNTSSESNNIVIIIEKE